MRLLIVRHADAGDAEDFAKTGKPDSERPLSKKGRDQMREASKGLVELVPEVDLVVSSPFTRALQTEEIVREAYTGKIRREVTETLEPERPPSDFARWLRDHAESDVVMAVGHEPHLSTTATWFVAGGDESAIELKKGGACLLDFDGKVEKGAATLLWLMTSRHLRAIAESL